MGDSVSMPRPIEHRRTVDYLHISLKPLYAKRLRYWRPRITPTIAISILHMEVAATCPYSKRTAEQRCALATVTARIGVVGAGETTADGGLTWW